jgi:carbonic anhydrase/acetyltransferase-like protein (isoleucine patch superfamily)
VQVIHGQHELIGMESFVGPYATLNAAANGFIRIGTASNVLDNATLIANPNHSPQASAIIIGDKVSISFGATILGPSTIGAFGKASLPTEIGPNALIDGATIEPGAIVSALARVGPGVTLPTGFRVLPGVNVTTEAEASNPALGKVVPVTGSDLSRVTSVISDTIALAGGYASLYQGNRATGISLGVDPTITTIFNGSLATVEGASQEPGSAVVKFEPTAQGPKFPSPSQGLVEGLLFNFPARVVGQVIFHSPATVVAQHLGGRNAIRADEGQPIVFNSFPTTGRAVTINSPLSNELDFGINLQAGNGAVILGGPLAKTTDIVKIGDDVSIGAGSVVDRSSVGAGSVIGTRAVVLNSALPANSVVPDGTIMVGNKVVGTIEW